jgi:hypothetical protein
MRKGQYSLEWKRAGRERVAIRVSRAERSHYCLRPPVQDSKEPEVVTGSQTAQFRETGLRVPSELRDQEAQRVGMMAN